MVYHERDNKGGLIPAGEVPQEFMQLVEKMDDSTIVARMTSGGASQAFFYRYKINTKDGVKEIIGISVDGADELANMIGNLRTEAAGIRVDKDSDPDYAYSMVPVTNIVRNTTLVGVGRNCKFVVGKDNRPQRDRPDEHWFVKAVGKGQRNAILKHVPEEIIVEAFGKWNAKGRGQNVSSPPVIDIDAPAKTPAPQQRATAPPRQSVPAEKPVALAPPAASSPPASEQEALAKAITKQQEKLKQLRLNIHNKFQRDLGISTEKRKDMLKEKFGIESLTDMTEAQLNDASKYADELLEAKSTTGTQPTAMAPAPATEQKPDDDAVAKSLGFDSKQQQGNIRIALFQLLTSPENLGLTTDEARKFVSDRGYAKTTDMPKDAVVKMIQEVDELLKAKQGTAEQPKDEEAPF